MSLDTYLTKAFLIYYKRILVCSSFCFLLKIMDSIFSAKPFEFLLKERSMIYGLTLFLSKDEFLIWRLLIQIIFLVFLKLLEHFLTIKHTSTKRKNCFTLLFFIGRINRVFYIAKVTFFCHVKHLCFTN